MMPKNIYEKTLKKFLCQSGALLLSTLVVTGLISLGVALYSVGKKSEELKKELPAWEYADQQDSSDAVDLSKLSDEQKAQFVKFAVEGGEAAVGAYDDTGLLTIVDKTGIFKAGKQDDKTSEEIKEGNNIKEQLKQKNLPDDTLMTDVAKVIKKNIIKKAKKDLPQEDIDKLLYDTLTKIQEEVDDTVNILNTADEFDEIEDIYLIDAIEQALKEKDNLEAEEIIKLKTQLSRLELDKKYIEEKLSAYKYYEEKGYIISNTSDITGLKDRLDDVNNKISQANSQIQKLQSQNEQADTAEETTETTQDSEQTAETSSEETADTVIYLYGNGKLTGFTETNIELTVDLVTGNVTGSISCKGSQPYYGDGGEDSGIRCSYVFNSSLTGNIDLSTYKLTVYADDYVRGISGGVCASLKPHHYKTTLTGTLNEAATYISGKSSMGGTWTASR